MTATPPERPDADEPSHLDSIAADLAELKSTLSAELAALRESIASRSVAPSPAPSVEPVTEAKATEGARSNDPQASYGAALAGAAFEPPGDWSNT